MENKTIKMIGMRSDTSGKIHSDKNTEPQQIPILIKLSTAEVLDLSFSSDNPNDEVFVKTINWPM